MKYNINNPSHQGCLAIHAQASLFCLYVKAGINACLPQLYSVLCSALPHRTLLTILTNNPGRL